MKTFSELGLPSQLLRALERSGITQPTPIQTQAIPIALTGRDLVACAQTGTGKTLAFSLPLVTRLLSSPRGMALVLVPTRELGVQVQAVLRDLLAEAKLPAPCLLIGGVSYGPQVQALARRPRVVVATPGRLQDHLQDGRLRLDNVEALVLDEADRMLDMGFLPQVRNILRFLPKERQTLLFSATLPASLRTLLRDMLRDPAQVFVDPPSSANERVEQRMLKVTTDDKQEVLLDELNAEDGSVLVFARTKRRTDRVARYLEQFGVEVDRIHGDRSQSQRQRAIDGFRDGRVRVLVATDIAARGLDIPQVALVINFDLPDAREDYVHRIGRTGRAGAEGEALSLVAPDELRQWEFLSGDGKGKPCPAPRPQQRNQRPQSGGRHRSGGRPHSGSRPQSGSRGGRGSFSRSRA